MINIGHDALTRLWKSTRQFHLRFRDTFPTTEDAIRPFFEEAKEVVHAAQYETVEQLTDEAADVVVTLIGLLLSRNVTRDEFEAAMERVAAKNDAKTHETHYIRDDGKIARRESVA